MSNDLSLLRPFNLEAAKAGAPICTRDGRNARFVAYVPECSEGLRVLAYVENRSKCEEYFENGQWSIAGVSGLDLCMAPLAWVEDKPVYTGDVLYSKFFKKRIEPKQGRFVVGNSRYGHYLTAPEFGEEACTHPDSCSWSPPVVKREGWINISPRDFNDRGWVDSINGLVSHSYTSRKNADKYASPDRIACIRIEWEEHAGEKE